jgi:hypothetical protein
MDQGVKRTQRDYSVTFKLAVVDQIEKVLDAAQVRGLREGENPVRWRGHLNTSCVRRKRKARQRQHFPAMRWQGCACPHEHPRPARGTAATATRLLILTGARAQMVRFATQDEFEAAGLIAVNPLLTLGIGFGHS